MCWKREQWTAPALLWLACTGARVQLIAGIMTIASPFSVYNADGKSGRLPFEEVAAVHPPQERDEIE